MRLTHARVSSRRLQHYDERMRPLIGLEPFGESLENREGPHANRAHAQWVYFAEYNSARISSCRAADRARLRIDAIPSMK